MAAERRSLVALPSMILAQTIIQTLACQGDAMATRLAAETRNRRLRFLRFGLLVIVCVGFAGSLSLSLLAPQTRSSGILSALLDSLLYTATVTAGCALAYQVYKRFDPR